MCTKAGEATARSGELDALRGIAALAVMLYHYTYFIEGFVPGPLPSVQLQWGCHGVPLFFAISGFVIATTLSRTRTIGEFAWRRAVRLLPSYWFGMLLTTAVVIGAGASQYLVALAEWPGNIAMIQFWTNAHMIDGVYWTLNVELAFYLCMAAIWRLGLLNRIEPVLAGWLLLPIFWARQPELAPALRMLLVAGDVPFFAIGILTARIRAGERTLEQLPWIAASVFAIWMSRPSEIVIVGVAVALIMVAVATGRAGWLARAPLLWLGRISYPLYLTHAVIGYILIANLRAAGLSADAATLVTIVLSLCLADRFTRWWDEPVRAWLAVRAKPRAVASFA